MGTGELLGRRNEVGAGWPARLIVSLQSAGDLTWPHAIDQD